MRVLVDDIFGKGHQWLEALLFLRKTLGKS
jgi:hypothetical protein